MEQDEKSPVVQPRIVRGRVDSLSIYEVTDYELSILEHGSPSSIYLNFAIFFLSIGLSFLIALVTTKIESSRQYDLFAVIMGLGLALGFVFLILWAKSHNEVSDVIKRIKGRMKELAAENSPVEPTKK